MRALISVSDKTGLERLGPRLHVAGIEIVSTGGTQRVLVEAGVPVTPVSDVTGFPEILDGRVKTLHPAIYAGLLARRDNPDHVNTLLAHGLREFDLVVCNLYPFAETVRNNDVTLDVALEQIDIGGPSMIRAAAKNFPAVLILVDPGDYDLVAEEISSGRPVAVSLERRRALAAKAFAHVSAYDSLIAEYLRTESFPEQITIAARKVRDLRYGENPHQRAALYARDRPGHPLAEPGWTQRLGPDISYNNVLDATAAWQTASEFAGPAASIIKHNVPCGVAEHDDIEVAFEAALAGDPVSAFGGVVAVNREVDSGLAERIARDRYDVLIAPGYTQSAIETLAGRRNIRCLEASARRTENAIDIRVLHDAVLMQEIDDAEPAPDAWKAVTRREPTPDEIAQLMFAWRVVKHVKSNAIVLASGSATVGIGGGQPNRVDAVRIAVERAGERARGSVLASDAFFPFPDGVEAAVNAGVIAIAQPGGSRRDAEVIDAADRAGAAMVFTAIRHFRH